MTYTTHRTTFLKPPKGDKKNKYILNDMRYTGTYLPLF